MRVLAFALFSLAAFDWPLPFLDRVGTAALGLAFLALALPAGGGLRRPARMTIPPKRVQVRDDLADELDGDVLARIAPYLEPLAADD